MLSWILYENESSSISFESYQSLQIQNKIVSKKLDILCFTSILCIFVSCRCLTSKEHFFLKQINSESLFWSRQVLGLLTMVQLNFTSAASLVL